MIHPKRSSPNNGLLTTSYQNVSLSATQSVTAKKTLWRWKKLRFFLPRISIKARISHCPHLTFSLRLTHRNRQRTNSDLRTPDGDKQGLDSPTTTYPTPPSSFNDPVEAFKRQGEGEHVLENEEARESFDGHAAYMRQYLKAWNGLGDLRCASTMYSALATAPHTIPITTSAKKKSGQNQPYVAVSALVQPKP